MIKIMRPSLLSRPRNVAERFPCPDPSKPRVVWAIPGYDLACAVAKPHGWTRPLVPPSPKLSQTTSRCRAGRSLSPASSARSALLSVLRAGHPSVGAGMPDVSRPVVLCLLSRRRAARR